MTRNQGSDAACRCGGGVTRRRSGLAVSVVLAAYAAAALVLPRAAFAAANDGPAIVTRAEWASDNPLWNGMAAPGDAVFARFCFSHPVHLPALTSISVASVTADEAPWAGVEGNDETRVCSTELSVGGVCDGEWLFTMLEVGMQLPAADDRAAVGADVLSLQVALVTKDAFDVPVVYESAPSHHNPEVVYDGVAPQLEFTVRVDRSSDPEAGALSPLAARAGDAVVLTVTSDELATPPTVVNVGGVPVDLSVPGTLTPDETTAETVALPHNYEVDSSPCDCIDESDDNSGGGGGDFASGMFGSALWAAADDDEWWVDDTTLDDTSFVDVGSGYDTDGLLGLTDDDSGAGFGSGMDVGGVGGCGAASFGSGLSGGDEDEPFPAVEVELHTRWTIVTVLEHGDSEADVVVVSVHGISDVAGNVAAIDQAIAGSDGASVVVDGDAPGVARLGMTTDNAVWNRRATAGDTIHAVVSFTEDIVVEALGVWFLPVSIDAAGFVVEGATVAADTIAVHPSMGGATCAGYLGSEVLTGEDVCDGPWVASVFTVQLALEPSASADFAGFEVALEVAAIDAVGHVHSSVLSSFSPVLEDEPVVVDVTPPTVTAVEWSVVDGSSGWTTGNEVVYVVFAASEPVLPPIGAVLVAGSPAATVTVAELAAIVDVNDGNVVATEWVAEVVLAADAVEGPVAVTVMALVDAAGVASIGTPFTGVTDSTGTMIAHDSTPPELVLVLWASSHPPLGAVAKVGDAVTIEILASEPIQRPTVNLNGAPVEVEAVEQLLPGDEPGSSICPVLPMGDASWPLPNVAAEECVFERLHTRWTATHMLALADAAAEPGDLHVAVSGIFDAAGNVGADFGGSGVHFDAEHPSVEIATWASTSATSSEVATSGDTITVSLTFTEPVTLPTVSIGGTSAGVTVAGIPPSDKYTAFLLLHDADTARIGDRSAVEVSVTGYFDTVSNAGDVFIATLGTNDQAVTVDAQAPFFASVVWSVDGYDSGVARIGSTLVVTVTASEPVTAPTVSLFLDGAATSVDMEPATGAEAQCIDSAAICELFTTFTGSHVFTESDPSGQVLVNVAAVADEAGHLSDDFTANVGSDGHQVMFVSSVLVAHGYFANGRVDGVLVQGPNSHDADGADAERQYRVGDEVLVVVTFDSAVLSISSATVQSRVVSPELATISNDGHTVWLRWAVENGAAAGDIALDLRVVDVNGIETSFAESALITTGSGSIAWPEPSITVVDGLGYGSTDSHSAGDTGTILHDTTIAFTVTFDWPVTGLNATDLVFAIGFDPEDPTVPRVPTWERKFGDLVATNAGDDGSASVWTWTGRIAESDVAPATFTCAILEASGTIYPRNTASQRITVRYKPAVATIESVGVAEAVLSLAAAGVEADGLDADRGVFFRVAFDVPVTGLTAAAFALVPAEGALPEGSSLPLTNVELHSLADGTLYLLVARVSGFETVRIMCGLPGAATSDATRSIRPHSAGATMDNALDFHSGVGPGTLSHGDTHVSHSVYLSSPVVDDVVVFLDDVLATVGATSPEAAGWTVAWSFVGVHASGSSLDAAAVDTMASFVSATRGGDLVVVVDAGDGGFVLTGGQYVFRMTLTDADASASASVRVAVDVLSITLTAPLLQDGVLFAGDIAPVKWAYSRVEPERFVRVTVSHLPSDGLVSTVAEEIVPITTGPLGWQWLIDATAADTGSYTITVVVVAARSAVPPAAVESGLVVAYPVDLAVSAWATCSAPCGWGVRTRGLTCTNVRDPTLAFQTTVDVCARHMALPATEEACYSGECVLPSWSRGDWEPAECPVLCGGGEQTRRVTCELDGSEVLDESQCVQADGPKPATARRCNTWACDTFEWVDGDWGSCDVLCGVGQRQRDVFCRSQQSGNVVSDSNCVDAGLEAPPFDEPCYAGDCDLPFFETGPWSVCNAHCGGGTSSRWVQCWFDSETRADALDPAESADCYEAAAAGGHDVPDAVKPCNTAPCFVFGYDVGEWSECSVPCDDGTGRALGVRSRALQCARTGGGERAIVPLQSCRNELPQHLSPPAEVQACGTQLCNPNFCDEAGGAGEGTDEAACNNHGSCDRVAQACVCDDVFEGVRCERTTACPEGSVVDAAGECCLSGVLASTDDSCCIAAPEVPDGTVAPTRDAFGHCCASGFLDICGVCDGTSTVTDAVGTCCMVLDAGGLCCHSGKVDVCGVCDGTSDCPVVAEITAALNGVTIEEAYDMGIVDSYTWLAIQQMRLDDTFDVTLVLSLPDDDSGSSRSRWLQDVLAAHMTLTVQPTGSASEPGLERRVLSVGDVSTPELEATSVDEVVREPVCGNSVCERGERCVGVEDTSCCSLDCAYRFMQCPTAEGSATACSGRGVCVSSTGECSCFSDMGYAGEDCSMCATGFVDLGDGDCRVTVAGQAAVRSGPDPAGAQAAADDGLLGFVPGDDTTLVAILGIVLFVLIIVVVYLVIGWRRRRRQTVPSVPSFAVGMRLGTGKVGKQSGGVGALSGHTLAHQGSATGAGGEAASRGVVDQGALFSAKSHYVVNPTLGADDLQKALAKSRSRAKGRDKASAPQTKLGKYSSRVAPDRDIAGPGHAGMPGVAGVKPVYEDDYSDSDDDVADPLRGLRPRLQVGGVTPNTIDLTWPQPASEGSAIVTHYKVTFNTGGRGYTVFTQDALPTFTIGSGEGLPPSEALEPGTEVTDITVVACNEVGESKDALALPFARTVGIPGCASSVRVYAPATTVNSFTLLWEPPTDDGGGRMLSYAVAFTTAMGVRRVTDTGAVSDLMLAARQHHGVGVEHGDGDDFVLGDAEPGVGSAHLCRFTVGDGGGHPRVDPLPGGSTLSNVQVAAVNAAGRGPWVTPTTTGAASGAAVSEVRLSVHPPLMPEDVTVGRTTKHTVPLLWSAPMGPVPSNHRISYTVDGERWTVNTGTGDTRFTIGSGFGDPPSEPVPPGTTVEGLAIRATSDAGASDPTDPLPPITTLRSSGPPEDVRVVATFAESVRVEWLAPKHSGGAPVMSYVVKYACEDDMGVVEYHEVDTEDNLTAFVIGGELGEPPSMPLQHGQVVHEITVVAVTRAGYGARSSPPMHARTINVPEPPAEVHSGKAVKVGGGLGDDYAAIVPVSWRAPPGHVRSSYGGSGGGRGKGTGRRDVHAMQGVVDHYLVRYVVDGEPHTVKVTAENAVVRSPGMLGFDIGSGRGVPASEQLEKGDDITGIQVAVANEVGVGGWSMPPQSATVPDICPAPHDLRVVDLPLRRVRLEWGAPPPPLGHEAHDPPITEYIVEYSIGDITHAVATSTTATGFTIGSCKGKPASQPLRGGDIVTNIKVRALTDVGPGLPSAPVIAHAQDRAGAPDVSVGDYSDTQIPLTWSDLEYNGGMEVLGWRVRFTIKGVNYVIDTQSGKRAFVIGGGTGSPASEPLVPGEDVTDITVQAQTELGDGEESVPIPCVTPYIVAGDPTGASAVRTNITTHTVLVKWAPPAPGYEGELTGYKIRYVVDDKVHDIATGSTKPQFTIGSGNGAPASTALKPRTMVKDIAICAVTTVGDSPYSAPMPPVTTMGIAEMPLDVTVTKTTSSTVSLQWAPPDDTGGLRITQYLVRWTVTPTAAAEAAAEAIKAGASPAAAAGVGAAKAAEAAAARKQQESKAAVAAGAGTDGGDDHGHHHHRHHDHHHHHHGKHPKSETHELRTEGPDTVFTIGGGYDFQGNAPLPHGTRISRITVRAVTQAGAGRPCHPLPAVTTFMVPSPPTNMVVRDDRPRSAGTLSVTWHPPESNGGTSVTAYAVRYAENGTARMSIASPVMTAAGTLTFTIGGGGGRPASARLPPGATVTDVSVAALNAAGESQPTAAEVSSHSIEHDPPPPCTPPVVLRVSHGTGKVLLAWENPGERERARIERDNERHTREREEGGHAEVHAPRRLKASDEVAEFEVQWKPTAGFAKALVSASLERDMDGVFTWDKALLRPPDTEVDALYRRRAASAARWPSWFSDAYADVPGTWAAATSMHVRATGSRVQTCVVEVGAGRSFDFRVVAKNAEGAWTDPSAPSPPLFAPNQPSRRPHRRCIEPVPSDAHHEEVKRYLRSNVKADQELERRWGKFVRDGLWGSLRALRERHMQADAAQVRSANATQTQLNERRERHHAQWTASSLLYRGKLAAIVKAGAKERRVRAKKKIRAKTGQRAVQRARQTWVPLAEAACQGRPALLALLPSRAGAGADDTVPPDSPVSLGTRTTTASRSGAGAAAAAGASSSPDSWSAAAVKRRDGPVASGRLAFTTSDA